jgi:hypothetical protein
MVVDSLGLIMIAEMLERYIIDESENTNGQKMNLTCLIYIILVKNLSTL